MSKRRKKKGQGLKKDTKLFLWIALAFTVLGVGAIIVGNIMYAGVRYDDVRTVEARVVSVEKQLRNLSQADIKVEENRGRDREDYMYEYKIDYEYTVDGKVYSYTRMREYNRKRSEPSVGDTKKLRIAVTDDGIIMDPQDEKNNSVVNGGFFAFIGTVIFLALALLRQKV